jgi:hypothetical protein
VATSCTQNADACPDGLLSQALRLTTELLTTTKHAGTSKRPLKMFMFSVMVTDRQHLSGRQP